jgi:hypothetical protein
MSFDPKVIEALAWLREFAARNRHPISMIGVEQAERVVQAINALDNAGVFAALDEQTDYASAEEILAEGAAIDMVRQSNPNVPADKALQVLHSTWHPERERGVGYPEQKSGRWAVADPDLAEWGDTTRADMARHQGVAGDQPEDELGFPLGGSLHSCVFGDKCPYPHAH